VHARHTVSTFSLAPLRCGCRRIHLQAKGLQGTLPTDWGNMTALTYVCMRVPLSLCWLEHCDPARVACGREANTLPAVAVCVISRGRWCWVCLGPCGRV
jgi:hypothetical protein